VELDDLLGLIQERRGCTREQARAALAAMPGGELLSGRVDPDDSPLAMELAQEDPE